MAPALAAVSLHLPSARISHPISRRLVAKCDGCLRIGGPSAGADQMVTLARAHGKQIYFHIEEIPGGAD